MDNRGFEVELYGASRDDGLHRNCDELCHIKTLPYLSVVQSVLGSYSISVGGSPMYETGPGGIFIAGSGAKQVIVHHVDKTLHAMKNRWVFFDVTVDGINMDILYDYPVVADEKLRRELNAGLDMYFAAADDCERATACLYMAGKLMKASTRRSLSPDLRLANALRLIKTRYSEPLDISELSAAAAMSPSRFYAVFRETFGKSAIAYLNDYRLSMASAMLEHSDLSVGEIARRVGIPDQFYFSRIFRRKFSMTPSAYRKATADLGVFHRESRKILI